MKHIIKYFFTIVFFSLFFTGCEVGITPLEQGANELNVATTGTVDEEGDIQTVNIEIPETSIELNVSVELFGPGSEYFTIVLDKNAHGYQGEVTLNPNHPHPVVYVDKTYTFFARTVVNGQKLCKASVTKTILHTEIPPVAEDINVTLDEKTNILIDLNATDKNSNDTLSYHIIRNPKYGTLLLPENSASATYTDINSSGADSFTYAAYDGKMFSNIATVNIEINAIPDTIKPVIALIGTDVNLTVGDTYTDAGATANDNVDGNITATIVTTGLPINTTVAGTYTVAYNVTDAANNAATEVTRTVTVNPDAMKPTIALNGDENITLAYGATYTDAGATANDNVDGNITVTIVTTGLPIDTTVAGTYTVAYNVTDTANNAATEVTRTVTVNPDAIKPIITLVGGDVNLSVGDGYSDAGATAHDNVDGDITSQIVTSGDMVDTTIPGNYIITYDVNDSVGNVAIQKIRIVRVINHTPMALGKIYSMLEDTNLTIMLQGMDVDNGAVLIYDIVDTPSNGVIIRVDDTVIYTPNPDYFGIDGFTFLVRDEFNATSNVVNIDINISDVAEPNNTPIAQDINISMDSNVTLITFDLNASDVDLADTLTYSIVDSLAFGTVTIDDNQSGQVTYDRGTYTGNTSFTYKVNDGTIDSNIATVTIKSNVINSPPIAYDQSINLDESGAPIILLDANDTDITDTLNYRIGMAPSYGTVWLIDNKVTYIPHTNYTGNDSFTFIANDGTDDSNEALVYMEVGTTQLESRLFSWCKNNDEELWRTDGTPSGTARVKDIRSGGDSSIPQSFVKIKNTYFFVANDGVHGKELWKSQGTEGSTVLVKDIKTKGNAKPHNLIDINGTLFFAAKDGSTGIELWKSDGTTLGTKLVKNINKHGQSKPENMTNVNGMLYFTANNGNNGIELWRSDGTEEGTNQVNDINSNGHSRPQYLTNVNGVLYFSADDGGTIGVNGLGRELWYYNTNISDIESGFTNRGYFDIFGGSAASDPSELFNYNGTLVFSAKTTTFGRELWISDGTELGPKMHSNYAGDNTAFGDYRYIDSTPHSFITLGGTLYFSAYQYLSSQRLRKIQSINVPIETVTYENNGTNYAIPSPENLIKINDTLFFSTTINVRDANNTIVDNNTWLGTLKGYYKIYNSTTKLTNYDIVNGELLFRLTHTDGSESLKVSDGTEVTDLISGCGL